MTCGTLEFGARFLQDSYVQNVLYLLLKTFTERHLLSDA